ncbi:reverse transcriptase domain-containing protein [Tanacetum coccineum]
MTTPVEKRNASKFCELHREVGHTTDECMHLKRQIGEMLKEGKLSHLIKALKQSNGKDQEKAAKKRETSRKDKLLAILMEDGTEGPMIIEAEMGGHFVYRMYVDEGSSSEILYEHCFNRFRPEVRSQMVPATTPLVGFSGEIIWPLGQISLLVKIGDQEHSTSAWMNFMIVMSLSPYNGCIGRPRVRRIQAVPSIAHGMLKFPVTGGTVTLRSSKIIPLECTLVSRPGVSLYFDRRRAEGAMRPAKAQPRYILLEASGYDWSSTWLSNPVMVKKHDSSWRMCVDFKDLNKACPKDGYPLPEIDWKVESLCGYPFKCFLDAYKGYHQIKMAEEDEENTTFITSQRIFCYSKMPFGLKNAGATYQRLVDKAFQKQSGQNLERDKHKVKSQKCTFGMREGMFLGYKVNVDGLKVCPDKVEAVLNFPSHKCLKDVQRLNGKMASINRFLSKSAEKSFPFFKTLKKYTKKSDFQWTVEAETTFKQMKTLIAELSMLTAPKEKEELIIYLATAREAISTVLMTERNGKQMPIYFVSRALQGPKINYIPMEKLILALVKRPEDDPPDTPIEDKEELPDPWILFTDGSSCIDGSGTGLIITNLEGIKFTYALRFRFNSTNNEAEYEALIAGLRIAEQIGVKNLQANVDSRLVANQVNGTYVAKEPGMIKYLEKVKNPASTFKEFSIKQVPRGENKKADALSKMASTNFAHLSKQVFVEELKEKSIYEKEVLAIVEEEGRTQMTSIYEYLMEEILPEETKKARAICRKSGRYVVTNGILYKRSFLGPWLRCVRPLQANYILREIHEGSCSMHAGPRSVVAKALRSGYYWPTMHADARKLIRECNSCQVHRLLIPT